jgi:protein TonB
MSASYRRRSAVHADIHAEETMFTTLVESRAVRRRSVRGAVLSVVAHTLVIAAAVAVTYPTVGVASPDVRPQPPVIFVPAPPQREIQRTPTRAPSTPTTPSAPVLSIPVPTTIPTSLPPIDIAGPSIPTEVVIGGRELPAIGPGTGSGEVVSPGGILDAGVVDRVPRIIGNAQPPRYPDVLRQSGATGQVVVRFVVDTLGRAEVADLVVVEATHPLFASAVKNALLAYRFTAGEAAGRKVRTMVQIPFTFTLR